MTLSPSATGKPGLIVICGATATGKSGLAMAIAQRLGSPIVSADSRQVYREFDIGTAKPDRRDRALVPHEAIDVCDPTETYTVAAYQSRVADYIETAHQQGRTPLLVGGTGLYIDAIVRGLKIPRVPPLPALRSQLAALGQLQCYGFLQQVDSAAAAKIHPNDAVRTLRALEVFYTTGVPLSAQQGENPPDYPILKLGLACASDALDDRIRQRTEAMVAAGFVKEVAALLDKYGGELPLLATLGYAEMKRHLAGELSLEGAIAETVRHTRQFAKRQRTWFSRDTEIEWFEANDPDLEARAWQRVRRWQQALVSD